MSEESEKKEFLHRNIWVTQKIRMEAEGLRLRLSSRLSILLNLITSLIVVLSALDLCIPNNKKVINFSLLSLMLSIIVVSLTLIVTNWNLEVSANKFKSSYLELQELYFDADSLDLVIIKKKYGEILNKYDNHTNLDYIYFKHSQQSKNLEFKCSGWENFIVWATKIVPDIMISIVVCSLCALIIFYTINGG